jgi:hypothetical protein
MKAMDKAERIDTFVSDIHPEELGDEEIYTLDELEEEDRARQQIEDEKQIASLTPATSE